MINVPLTAVIAFLGIFVTARFQRLHWLRSARAEILARETKDANDLVRDIAKSFDKRIAAQRALLRNLSSPDLDFYRDSFRDAVREYSEGFNEIRYRLYYYTTYRDVIDFERRLHDRLVENSNAISGLLNSPARDPAQVSRLDADLSILSARIFKYCKELSRDIADGKVGALKRIRNWKEPSNEFVSNWSLIKRLLNL